MHTAHCIEVTHRHAPVGAVRAAGRLDLQREPSPPVALGWRWRLTGWKEWQLLGVRVFSFFDLCVKGMPVILLVQDQSRLSGYLDTRPALSTKYWCICTLRLTCCMWQQHQEPLLRHAHAKRHPCSHSKQSARTSTTPRSSHSRSPAGQGPLRASRRMCGGRLGRPRPCEATRQQGMSSSASAEQCESMTL